LIATRAAPDFTGPAHYALYADRREPRGAARPDLALAAGARAIPLPAAWPKRALIAAVTLAFALHLALITPMLVRPAGPNDHELGMQDGKPENVSVSMISEAELRRLSHDPFRQDALPAPAPAEIEAPPNPEPAQEAVEPQPPEPPPPPQPPAKEAEAAPSPSLFDAPEKPAPFDPSAFIAKASRQFTMQIERAVEAPQPRREPQEQRPVARSAGNVKALRPGATHSGKSDDFERKVVWALAGTTPMGNGKWGSAVVTFIVSEAGKADGLRLIKSSGDNWLDTGVLMAVRQTRLPVPSAGLTAGDRTFIVEYISTQGRF
jgi:periplasmic protein TonB